MEFTTFLFYAFSTILVFAALRVITDSNPVHAALYLILSFFSASAIWMLLKAEFLAIVLVLVYVGAVMVLFLFVVMMLDINIDSIRKGFWNHFPLAATLGAVIALELAAVLLGTFRSTSAPSIPNPVAMVAAGDSNTQSLGIALYTHYIYPVEIAAVLLLVAIVAAIALTLRERKDVKGQNVADQVRVRAKDRLQIVKVAPVKPAVAAEKTEENPS